MKAYEIKVTLKHSKPPIWRKIIIPADINFMQLHNIIQTAFEWQNYHLYEFTFKEFIERITNDREAIEEAEFFRSKEGVEFRKNMGIKHLDIPILVSVLFAKDVLIENYFEKVKKLTYVYDFGDWWEHTIEIISIIDNYTGSCPIVTKYKQASPPDDCGGIYGYYDFLEQYASGDKKLKKWAEMQGYSGEYDIDEINEDMEEALEWDTDDFE